MACNSTVTQQGRSHCVGNGDVILSVCGQDSAGMSRRDVKRLLRDETRIDLELEYEVKEARFDTSGVYRHQRISIRMKKIYDSFGFILRKYETKSGLCCEYPIISNIRSGDSVDKDNCLKAGDRLIQIDDRNLSKLPLTEVSEILSEKEEATFLIEYNVAILDGCIRLGERTVLEIDVLDADLGIVLASSAKDGSSIFIESIRKGSLAERCGAFHIGDVVLCINDISTSHLVASEANALVHNLQKQNGQIVYVPNKEKRQLQREITPPCFDTNSKCLKDISPMTRSFILDQRQLIPPRNSPASLYNWHFKKTSPVLEKADRSSFNFQTKTITMMRDVIRNISNFEQFIPFLDSDLRQKTDGQKLDGTNVGKEKRYDKVDPNRISQLKAICTETKDSARTIAMHLVKNSIDVSVLNSDGKCKSPDGSYSDTYFTRSKMLLDLKDNLAEICTRQLITKNALDSFLKNVSAVDFDCCVCYPLCLSASLTVQKIVLLLSLNDQEWDIKFIINKLLMNAMGVDVPCNDCRTPWCSVSDSGQGSPVVKYDVISQLLCTNNRFLETDPFPFSSLQTSMGNKQFSSPSNESNGSKACTSRLSNETFPKQVEVDLNFSKKSALYRLTQNNCEPSKGTINNQKVYRSQLENAEEKTPSVYPQYHNTIPQESHSTEHPDVKSGNNQLSKEILKRLQSGQTIAENYVSNCQEKIHADKSLPATSNINWRSEEAILRDNEESSCSTKLLSKINKHSSDPSGCIKKFHSPEGLFKNCKSVPVNLSPRSTVADCLRIKTQLSNSCTSSSDEVEKKTLQYSTVKIKLKDEGRGFGLEFGLISFREFPLVPVVLDIKPESAAAKVGIIMKGDRIVEINGQDTVAMNAGHLTKLTREAFAGEEVDLVVEFDVVIPEMRFGTFDICFEKSVKPGLEFKDLSKGSPLLVKGVVKGSAAHRSGQLFPGDEILFTNCIRQEAFDSCNCSYQRTDMVLMTVRRKATTQEGNTEPGPCPQSEDISPPPQPSSTGFTNEEVSFVVHRTSIHTLADSKDTVLEQQITLFRDQNHQDFGFLVGQNQKTGAVYVTGIRPGGPADKAKVIKKKDRIMQIDGSPVGSAETSSLSLLLQAGDRLDLVTRRVLTCREG